MTTVCYAEALSTRHGARHRFFANLEFLYQPAALGYAAGFDANYECKWPRLRTLTFNQWREHVIKATGLSSFQSDWAHVLEMQSHAAQDVMNGLDIADRAFENPDVMEHLPSLSGSQKLVLLRDMTRAKQSLTAYLDQYGDNISNGDDLAQTLDKNINTLKNDHDVLKYMSEAVATDITKLLQQTGGSALLSHLESDYESDIIEGKALYHATEIGKSPEDAIKAYLSEVGLLHSVLPKSYLASKADAARNTLAKFAVEQMIGGVPKDVDLDALVGAGGMGLSNPTVNALSILNEHRAKLFDGLASAKNGTERPSPVAVAAEHSQKLSTSQSHIATGDIIGVSSNRHVANNSTNSASAPDPLNKVIMEAFSAAGYVGDFPSELTNTFAPTIELLAKQVASRSQLDKPTDFRKVVEDITKSFGAAWNKVRNGMKLSDAMTQLAKVQNIPVSDPGLGQDIYRSGIAKAASALLGGGVLAAKYADGVHSPKDVATLVAGGVSQFGGLLEASGKFADPKNPLPIFGGVGQDSWRANLDEVFGAKNIVKAGITLGALGGLAGAGISFFAADESLKHGDAVEGALSIVGGVASSIGTTASVLEGLNSITGGQISSSLGRMLGSGSAEAGALGIDAAALGKSVFKTALAAVGDGASLVGAVAAFGLGVWDMAKGAQVLDNASVEIANQLQPLIGAEPEWIDRPDPDFIW